jgi:hypothetical protein
MRHDAARLLTLALTLLAAVGCATRPVVDVGIRAGNPDWVVEVRAIATAVPARLPADADDAAILNMVALVIAHDLELPLPPTVLAVAYRDEATLAEGLVHRGLRSEPASEAARVSAAVATHHGILLRADLVSRMSLSERVVLYAHELAHIAQRRIDRWQATPLWILEGHAQWVAYRVVERLGLGSFGHLRSEQRRLVLASRPPGDPFPPLNALETSQAWTQAVQRLGWAATYGQAFLAVDRLVERHTEARLREFLRGFAWSRPVHRPGQRDPGDWEAAFPVSYHRFLIEFRAHLETLR